MTTINIADQTLTSGTTRGMYITRDDGSSVYFDVTLSDESDSVLELTKHPVEVGADITDAARLKVPTFSFEVGISETPIFDTNVHGGAYTTTQIAPSDPKRQYPINPLGAAVEGLEAAGGALGAAIFGGAGPDAVRALTWTAPFHAVHEMNVALRDLQGFHRDTGPRIITLYTSKYYVPNCILTRFKQTRDKSTGSGAKFKLEFEQLRQVTLQTTDAPLPAEPEGEPSTDQGNQGTAPAPADKESVVSNITGAGA